MFSSDLPVDYYLKVSGNDQLAGYSDPIVRVDMPKLVDTEGDEITTVDFSMVTPSGYKCNCITMMKDMSKDIPLWLEINREDVRAAEMGDYKVIFELRDDKYELSYKKSVFNFDF